jgi:hypothetical protein
MSADKQAEIENLGYRPVRTWQVNDKGQRVVSWMAAAPDGGDWSHGSDDLHVSGMFRTRTQALSRCRAMNKDIWGDDSEVAFMTTEV